MHACRKKKKLKNHEQIIIFVNSKPFKTNILFQASELLFYFIYFLLRGMRQTNISKFPAIQWLHLEFID